MARAAQPVDDAEPFDPQTLPAAVCLSMLEMEEDDRERAERARDLHVRLQELIGAELADVVAGCLDGHQGPPAPWLKSGVERVHNRNGLLLDAIEKLVVARQGGA